MTSCVITSHPPLRVSHMGRCLSSWTVCWWSRPACVLINVCQFMWVCTLVSKGWDRQWREQRLLVPEVRSACRHDTLPFSRTPVANIHTHMHTRAYRMVLLPQQHHQHPLLQLLVFNWQNAPSVLPQNGNHVLCGGLSKRMTSSKRDD